MNVQALPDKGEKLLKQIQALEDALSALALSPEQGKMGFALELSVGEHGRRVLRKGVFAFLPYCWFQLSPNGTCCCL